MFGIVVVVAFQSVFCLEMYQNIFLIFLTSVHQNDPETPKKFI